MSFLFRGILLCPNDITGTVQVLAARRPAIVEPCLLDAERLLNDAEPGDTFWVGRPMIDAMRSEDNENHS